MRRLAHLGLGGLVALAAGSPAVAAGRPDGGAGPVDAGLAPLAVTSTRTGRVAPALLGASAEELELARWLDVLENLEVLENWELLSVMPALEDDE